MLRRLFRRLRDLFLPFRSIARSLRVLVELYEEDLASRTPPVIRRTEAPSRKDTEVFLPGSPDHGPEVLVDEEDWA